jgi:hypothetical protein
MKLIEAIVLCIKCFLACMAFMAGVAVFLDIFFFALKEAWGYGG